MATSEDPIPHARGRTKGTVMILLDGELPLNQLECLIWSLGFEEAATLTVHGSSKKFVDNPTSMVIRDRDSFALSDYYDCDYGIYMRRFNFVNSLPEDAVAFAKDLTRFFKRVRVLEEFPGEKPLYDSRKYLPYT